MIAAPVAGAVSELRTHFGPEAVTVKEDGEGGAYVLVEQVNLGEAYTAETRTTWLGFKIGFQYPLADVYPHHVRPDLARADGHALGAGMSATQFEGFGGPSIQFSRRSKEGTWGQQTALLKLLKVVEWAKVHPGG